MRDKLCAFRFREHEIADRELADFGIVERTAEIFWTKLNPALADLNVRAGTFFRFDIDVKMIGCQIITDCAALIVNRPQQNIERIQIAERSLGIDVKLAERFNLVAKKFQTHR